MHVHANNWADWTLWDWTRDAEVAEGVLDEVGPHHLKNMHILGGKTERADATRSLQKTPCKKNSREAKTKIFFWPLLLLNLLREGTHMEKNRLKKTLRQKKKKKTDWKSCFTPHKWLIGMVAARSTRPATAATAATTTAATTTATLGGQVWLGHPLQFAKYCS